MADLMPGDILLWWAKEWVLTLPDKNIVLLPLPTPIAVHSDIYVGGGRVRTCIQNKGTCGSTVSKRKKQFLKGVAVRVTEPFDLNMVMKVAHDWEFDYDWGGYLGQFLDIFWGAKKPFPDFTSRSDKWTRKLQDKNKLYCSEHSAWCYYLKNGIKIAGKHPLVTSPQDIYLYAQKHKKTRRIIEL